MKFSDQDHHWMNQALELSTKAATLDEVPVGAVLVCQNTLLGSGFNQTITRNDPTAHAEIIALRDGAQRLDNYRILHSTLYVTLEPCIMCMGAIIHARIERLVFGAFDPKTGAAGSVYNIGADRKLNHTLEIQGGLLEPACSKQLKDFFRQKRENK